MSESLQEAIDQYQNAKKFIGDFFGVKIWHPINVLLDDKWSERYNGDVTYDNNGEIYSFELYGTSRWEKDGYVMFVGCDNGEKDVYLFKMENKVEDMEDE